MLKKNPNRDNARKSKPGSGCKMCKPWKGAWQNKFKEHKYAILQDSDEYLEELAYPKHINSKEQQASVGNWGHPRKDGKKAVKIKPYPNKRPNKKKKKKKPLYRSPFSFCPFCGYDLPVVNDNKKNKLFFWRNDYAKVCDRCGAKEVDEPCPACKCTEGIWRDTRGVITHIGYFNCGFKGKRIEQGLLREIDFSKE